jgi:hypothetical protein
MPIRGPTAIAGSCPRACSSNGGASSAQPSCSRVIASAWQSLPGPLQSPRTSSTPRRARMASSPCVGSSARISAASALPSTSHTTLRHQWMPYER